MVYRYLQITLISLLVTYFALTQHIFREKAILSFIVEHLIPIFLGLLLATGFYVYRYGFNPQ